MLLPKKSKFKKHFKGKIKGNTSQESQPIFGFYALKSLETTRLTSRQIESARKIISKKKKRLGLLWIRIFPDIPVTKKPTENRMGKGKGGFKHWVTKIKPGQILFELNGVSKSIAYNALLSASKKLPILTKIITK